MKKKLHLTEMKVKSFNTTLPKEEERRIKAGSGGPLVCTNYALCTWDEYPGCGGTQINCI